MKSKIKYTNEPLGELRVVKDFPAAGPVGLEKGKCEGNDCLEKIEH